jgi:putative hydrolase of the HAD superfamily
LAEPVEAVLFDWGGTLTPWHAIDFAEESTALAAAAVDADVSTAEVLRAAGDAVWARARDHHTSATIADVFVEAGLTHDESMLTAYREFWEPHTLTDPQVGPLFDELHRSGIRVGVLSNTIWPRAWHRDWFARDGVLDRIDADVYTSEIPWTKPSPRAFEAAMAAVGVTDPARCVYVGDRLFDDVWGAQNAGMRAILVPHSRIPDAQRGHTEGRPDAVVERLAGVADVIARWA